MGRVLLYILFIIFIIIDSGCGIIARKGYGAKKPAKQNRESIESWLSKNGLSNTDIVSIKPDQYLDYLFGLPQAPLLFDNKTGNLLAIGFSNGKYCPNEVDKSFSNLLPYNLLKEKPDSLLISEKIELPPGVSLNDANNYRKKDTVALKLTSLILPLRSLSGTDIEGIPDIKYDYTLIVPFGIFLGNRHQVKDLRTFYFSAIGNRFASIKTIFLNLDKQEWWGSEWDDKTKIKL